MSVDLHTYAWVCKDAYEAKRISKNQVSADRYKNFAAKVYRQGGEVIVSYAGTDDVGDAYEDAVGIGVVGCLLHAVRAINVARHAGSTAVCGHSLGGAYAQIVARTLNLICVTFNAPGAAQMTIAPSAGGVLNPAHGVISGTRNIVNSVAGQTMMYHFRHPQDVVSLIGEPCAPCRRRNLPMPPFLIPGMAVVKAHSIDNIEKWLHKHVGRGPAQF